jgi:lysozyme family protein
MNPDPAIINVVVERVLVREGGVADVGDGMGITRYGQTDGWLGQYGLPQPKTRDDAAANYRAWLHLTKLEALCTILDPLPDVVIDYAVNSGDSLAVEALQRAIGVTADGKLGPASLAALAGCQRSRTAHHVIADRLELIGHLITHKTEDAKFADNWMHRIGEQVRTLADS